MTYYYMLRVDERATKEAIKSAFRKLALECHPDKHSNSPESHARFILIQKAYAVLSDPEKRREYDRYISVSPGFRSRAAGSPTRMGKAQVLPPRSGDVYMSNEELLSHLNVILWDVEDLIRDNKSPLRQGGETGGKVEKMLFDLLAFMDKAVLEPAGFGDYFMTAREMPKLDPDSYKDIVASDIVRHKPYSGLDDYFYNIRIRVDKFLTRTRADDLLKTPAGSSLRLIDRIIEVQNAAVRILGKIARM